MMDQVNRGNVASTLIKYKNINYAYMHEPPFLIQILCKYPTVPFWVDREMNGWIDGRLQLLHFLIT